MRSIKKLFIAIAVILVISVSLPAQWGLKGGFESSKLHSLSSESEVYEQNRLTSFQIGMFYSIKTSSYLRICPELIYVRKGTKIVDEVNVNINYVEIPVLFQVILMPDKPITPYLIAGPYAAIRTRARNSDGDDLNDVIKSGDFGLIGGVGAQFQLGSTRNRIFVEARYEWGLSNIIDDDEDESTAKNGSFMFNVGISF